MQAASFFDYSLRTLEYEKLLPVLEDMTGSALNKSIILYNRVQNPRVKAAALKSIAYLGVSQKALEKDLPDNIPDSARDIIDAEYKLVDEQAGFKNSALCPFQLDYSQFKPRGHYTRNHDFERYFKAMMWYGLVPFPLYTKQNGKTERNIDQTLQAMLITCCIFLDTGNDSDDDRWNLIYDPTRFYVGNTDDLNIYDYKVLLAKVYGPDPDLDNLADEDKLSQFYKEADKLPEPGIKAEFSSVNTPTGKQFRLMGQRYIPDSEILQKLVDSNNRPMPKGLDIMGVLGSERAHDLLTNKYKENTTWNEYPKRFDMLKTKFSRLPDSMWQSTMYYGWLWTLQAFLKHFGEGYPSFMTNQAWEDKSLCTALASWAELRHDTILYAKQSGAECGGDITPPEVKSYVEPNIEAYEKLLWLTRYSRENLDAKQLLTDQLKNKMQQFEDLLTFLINCSIKELKNEELTKEEYYQLLIYGGTLEFLSVSLAGGVKGWYEITSETDKDMAIAADVHTVPGSYLEEAVGHAAQIFVVVPIGGKLYLTRGAVFSHYEFVSGTRLTDEEWQNMLKENKQPSQADWTDSFIRGEKQEIPVPKELYNSGY